jgi:hypothetical protein
LSHSGKGDFGKGDFGKGDFGKGEPVLETVWTPNRLCGYLFAFGRAT